MLIFEIKGDLMSGYNAFVERFGFKPKVLLNYGSTHYIDTKIPAGVK